MRELANIARGINNDLRARSSMKLGETVKHPYGYNVKILDGCYMDPVYGRVSNWWTWQRVNDDGTMGKQTSGYGW